MSIRLMSMVFDASPRRVNSTRKLVLLAQADHASDDGEGVYPSVRRLADKTGLSERTVQKTLRWLEENDLVRYVGRSPLQTKKYRINVARLAQMGGERRSPPRKRGESGSPQGVNVVRQGGESGSPDPSVKPSIKPSGGARKARPRDPLFDAITEVCSLDPVTAGSTIGKVRATLLKAAPPYTPEEVRAFGQWWWADEFRRKRGVPPRVWQLQEQIGIVRRPPQPGGPALDERTRQAQAELSKFRGPDE